jgi:hypothetical protein
MREKNQESRLLAFRKYPYPEVVLHDRIAGGGGDEWETKAWWAEHVCGRKDGIEGKEQS